MKTITGNNNFVFIQTNDGEKSEQYELDENTTLITNAEVAEEFSTQEELQTRIAQLDVTKFPALPEVGEWCEKNVVYKYGIDKAKCLQSHTRMHYAPEETPALFLIITTVSTYPVWKQPTGAHDSYQVGDRVTHNGFDWECTAGDGSGSNSWEPGVYGWTKI